ncbi:protein TRACHEARY ELEMENT DIFFERENTIATION-RELATED 7A-like, partial [Homarus americanus]|uniref:protein TRACHEARY ELEMENT DIFFERENTIATION-RELATED 7A-like n=1 Tax=Homarus americanus TaxID=6706 RepID=UPI001C4524C1
SQAHPLLQHRASPPPPSTQSQPTPPSTQSQPPLLQHRASPPPSTQNQTPPPSTQSHPLTLHLVSSLVANLPLVNLA